MNGGMSDRRVIALEDGWGNMEDGIMKLRRILDQEDAESFTSEEYMNLYTTIYNMCTQKAPYDFSEELYKRYEAAFNQYINSKVLPALVEKKGEYMLRSLMSRWENHKIMVRWLSRFFNYLDRYYVQRHHYATLNQVGVGCFRRLVYEEIKPSMKTAVLALIDKEREGEKK